MNKEGGDCTGANNPACLCPCLSLKTPLVRAKDPKAKPLGLCVLHHDNVLTPVAFRVLNGHQCTFAQGRMHSNHQTSLAASKQLVYVEEKCDATLRTALSGLYSNSL
jgi:hypothetical protein